MQCPYCEGTNRECGCGQGHCDHCSSGVVADYPMRQPKNIPQILSEHEVDVFAEYWCDHNRIETLSEFIQRVAYQASLKERMLKEIPTGFGELKFGDLSTLGTKPSK